MTQRYFDQLRRESSILHAVVVPRILERLASPPRIGTSESLAEVTLLARDQLERHLRENGPQGEDPVRVFSQVPQRAKSRTSCRQSRASAASSSWSPRS